MISQTGRELDRDQEAGNEEQLPRTAGALGMGQAENVEFAVSAYEERLKSSDLEILCG